MRYFYTDDLSSLDNMMIDSYLLHHSTLDFFRIYRWKRPTVSLGAGNDLSLLNFHYLKENNIDIVRRETGGGMIFHKDDLCFSMIGKNRGIPWENYKFVKDIIEGVFKDLGFQVTAGSAQNKRSPLCFLSRNRHEITVNDKKVVGIAQKISSGRSLIQGSIQLITLSVKDMLKNGIELVQYGLDSIDFNSLRQDILDFLNRIVSLELINVEMILGQDNYNDFKKLNKYCREIRCA